MSKFKISLILSSVFFIVACGSSDPRRQEILDAIPASSQATSAQEECFADYIIENADDEAINLIILGLRGDTEALDQYGFEAMGQIMGPMLAAGTECGFDF
jgi:hypothetical protein